ncbi:hypothetical protein Q4519_07710 [Motilimonas sp. 1_MG-2023]|uniref:hypothetical protein n=1 Tax=Motilimonas sp. 1_MG-2023 TaxID=3062672 RepID=UPI0026E1E298|nr:hypothetical protein [Motilimonas sp. 1_MG-2023]MDO6525567.1 hypothetical protein [Motilimonas sp. 1_MG-2023]
MPNNELTQEQLNLLCQDLAQVRLIADLNLAPQFPFFAEKPYPIGRCREIRDEVFRLLQQEIFTTTKPRLSLLREHINQGVDLKKAWGSLRDEYFQNAFILGKWYIDVANDTVNPSKPRVEILPLASSQFTAIKSFSQFAKIARSYWQVELYRNTVCPALAPYMPLLCVGKNGASWLAAANDDMINVAINSRFEESKVTLIEMPNPPAHIAKRWQQVLSPHSSNPFLVNQGDPVKYCEQYVSKGHHTDVAKRDAAVIAYSSLPKTV